MKCPACKNSGKPDSRPDPGVSPSFEFRGRLGTRVIVRCLKCGGGVFVRAIPPGYKAIPADQWRELDAFWQLRRAEILADLQAIQAYGQGEERPADEVVNESQTSFLGTVQNRASLLSAMGQAGYPSNDEVSDLIKSKPLEFAFLALKARQGNVIHDNYEVILARGGSPQSERAAARITAAEAAIAGGDDAVRVFLQSASASSPA
jgi:hypothetical protein